MQARSGRRPTQVRTPRASTRRRKRGWRTSSASSGWSSHPHCLAGKPFGLEDLATQTNTQVSELLGELRPDAGGLEMAPEPAVLVDAHAVVEHEDVLQRDDVAFHALHLGDVRDAPGAVPEAADVHDQVERRCHLLADGPDRKVE